MNQQPILDNALPALVLPLKSQYFIDIARGDKLEEFRLTTPFWKKRLVGKSFSHIEFTLGYPARGDVTRRLVRPWRGYRVITITHPHFGPHAVEVFAIRAN